MACRIAGWKPGAKQKPIPASSTHRATVTGSRSMTTPSASRDRHSRTRTTPARLPCLHTFTPAPATTIAAIVDTLIE